ncbi:hypothetical protein PHLCEN_2v869 [Hermanssonia centrifuga]|uniref:Uncharacterized protein n=1 Tax=Hermanssonia centrifuga TaxID=98765 RepID=A0A2R6S4S9_9APHY|nr:hypothetical protein PHLCEN_2v869 [Hermanssonia centrifuga]
MAEVEARLRCVPLLRVIPSIVTKALDEGTVVAHERYHVLEVLLGGAVQNNMKL